MDISDRVIVKFRIIGTDSMPESETGDDGYLNPKKLKKLRALQRNLKVQLHGLLYGYKRTYILRRTKEVKTLYTDGVLDCWNRETGFRETAFVYNQIDDATFVIKKQYLPLLEKVKQQLNEMNNKEKARGNFGCIIDMTVIPYTTVNAHIGIEGYYFSHVKRK